MMRQGSAEINQVGGYLQSAVQGCRSANTQVFIIILLIKHELPQRLLVA
jgi:hypothetical protein